LVVIKLRRKVTLSMLLLTQGSVIVAFFLLVFTFYNINANRIKSDIRGRSFVIERHLNAQDDIKGAMKDVSWDNSDYYIALIDQSGNIVFDNQPDMLDPYIRPDADEIIKTLDDSEGESRFRSRTQGQETHYYVTLLKDNSILCVGATTASFYGMFMQALPVGVLLVVGILILCLVWSQRLSQSLIEPINRFDFEESSDVYDDLAPFIRTITQQKREIKAVLDETNQKNDVIAVITDNMKEGLFLADKKGTILLANSSVLSLLHAEPPVEGKNVLEICRDMNVLQGIQRANDGENNESVITLDSRIYHVYYSSVDNGILVLFVDVTEKTKAENMRREFSANVSHELKTPLTTISGYSELLSSGVAEAGDTVEIAGKIKKESARMITLVTDIMRLSELDEYSGNKIFEQFELTEVIREVVENLADVSKQAGVTVSADNECRVVTANRTMIYEMLYNLTENAIKYNRRSGNVTIALNSQADLVEIEVSDTGIGIDPIHQDRIFERFYRVDRSRSKKKGGTGLGLSIVKHIVAYHDGTVSLQSQPGKGTKITVRLPVASR